MSHPSGYSKAEEAQKRAHETVIGLLAARDRQDTDGTAILMESYGRDIAALGLSDIHAQAMLFSASLAISLSAFRRLSQRDEVEIDDMLQAEGLRIHSWAHAHEH